MKKFFPLIMIFALSESIVFAQNLAVRTGVLDEMQPEIKDSDIFVQQLYVEQKRMFDAQISEKKNNNPKVNPLNWKKEAPSAEAQKDGVEVID